MAETVAVVREDDDKLAESRISLGRAKGVGMYIVFRGEPDKALKLLRDALAVAEHAIVEGRYADKRGRPQG